MSKEIYTEFLQSSIRRYGWQSYGSKFVSLLVALTFLVLAINNNDALSFENGTSLWLGCGVVLAFLLWCGDGYTTDMLERYKGHLSKVLNGSNDVTIEPDRLSLKAIWRPSLLFFHSPIMVIMVLVSISVK